MEGKEEVHVESRSRIICDPTSDWLRPSSLCLIVNFNFNFNFIFIFISTLYFSLSLHFLLFLYTAHCI